MKKIVTKLGGASLCDAESIKKSVLTAIKKGSNFIVVSAPGARGGMPKVTDLLVGYLKKEEHLLDLIISIFMEISDELGVDISGILEEACMEIEKSKNRDFVLAQGEKLNGMIINAWLKKEGYNSKFVDPTLCIFFKEDGSVDYIKTITAVKSLCVDADTYIIPGFYGMGFDGEVKTFPRDGSDISGSIIAVSVKADLYNMYKDVDGFCTADPRYVEFTQVISDLTFNEARILSFGGSKVIHKDALIPLSDHRIPLRISNPHGKDPGTLVSDKSKDMIDLEEARPIGIADKNTFCLFHISKKGMNDEIGFIERLLCVFKKMHISVDHIPTGIDSCAFLIDKESLLENIKNSIDSSIADIRKNLSNEAGRRSKVKFKDHVAVIVVVVSNKISRFSAIVDYVFDSVDVVQFSGQKLDNQIIVSLSADHLPRTLSALHNALFVSEIDLLSNEDLLFTPVSN